MCEDWCTVACTLRPLSAADGDCVRWRWSPRSDARWRHPYCCEPCAVLAAQVLASLRKTRSGQCFHSVEDVKLRTREKYLEVTFMGPTCIAGRRRWPWGNCLLSIIPRHEPDDDNQIRPGVARDTKILTSPSFELQFAPYFR